MTKLTILVALAAVSLGAQPTIAVADDVPTFDVSRTCRAEAQALPDAARSCMADEQRARETLVAQWSQFTSENKASCTQTSTDVAGIRSYVELLSCLQMARDARRLPRE